MATPKMLQCHTRKYITLNKEHDGNPNVVPYCESFPYCESSSFIKLNFLRINIPLLWSLFLQITTAVYKSLYLENIYFFRYEAASTLYGPHTLSAYIQQYKYLVDNLIQVMEFFKLVLIFVSKSLTIMLSTEN